MRIYNFTSQFSVHYIIAGQGLRQAFHAQVLFACDMKTSSHDMWKMRMEKAAEEHESVPISVTP